MNIEDVAWVCHETIRSFCEANDDFSIMPWHEANDWQIKSSISSVKYLLSKDSIATSDLHDKWVKDKIDDGWVFGDKKNVINKTHPCIVAYEDLSEIDKTKDVLFISTFDSLKNLIDEG